MIRIVVAEDQTLVLGALATLLSLEADLTVVRTASNGEEAMDAVRSLRPDVLVSDIEMPRVSGLDVVAMIAAEGLPTRVIIVTTFGRPGYLRRAMTAGVRGYLLKDAPADVLIAAIRQVAMGACAIAPELAEAAWDAVADPLTDRERKILRLAGDGRSSKEIARLLALSPGTVRNYLSEASSKLGASGRTEAVNIARENGWL